MLKTTGLEVGRPVQKLSNSLCQSGSQQEVGFEMVQMATLKKGLHSEVWAGLSEQTRHVQAPRDQPQWEVVGPRSGTKGQKGGKWNDLAQDSGCPGGGFGGKEVMAGLAALEMRSGSRE